ncbi:hypothetical protein COCNU_16G003470 [Cocos nucifera]|uniref:Tafazzin family protein n=1 Tax=Cocos nucifera TaxID=13894 RepID=A0A8K0NDQ1_COCNU|nr:hypothetical protein COCNU_16G003470 [Cocos nucifera]
MAGEWVERPGSLWKDRARALQLQIRDRFRVAVDRHRNWREEADYSLTLRRWILRVRSVWRVPSTPARSSSLRFYRKRVDKNVDEVDDSIVVRLLQALAVPVIGNACHVFMHGLNCVQIYGAEKLHQALLERPEGKPLITVSNHVASVDDPLVIASLLPPSVMLDVRNLRWTLCATDRCFTNPVLSAFFRCVKVLPVSRGEGIYQKVTVLIGDPIAFDDLLIDKDDAQHDSRGILYDAVSSRIGHRLQELKVQVDRLSLEQPLEVPEYYIHNSKRGYRIWQQVDWEAFGMGNFMLSEEDSMFVKRASPKQTVQNVDQPQKLNLTPRTVRVGFSYEGGIVSRIRGFMNPTDLMGFAARGLFMNGRTLDESCQSVQEVGLTAWKQFLEGNIFQQWNSM